MISLNPKDIKYGIGLGGFGENYDEYKEYFGEALVINKNLYFLYFISFLFSYFEINTYVCVTLN